MIGKETPKFTGITAYRDPRGRFSIRYPTDWQTFEIRSEEPLTGDVAIERHEDDAGAAAIAPREGIGFAPNSDDPHTVFTVWTSPLGEGVVAEDMEALKAGVDEGLHNLQECQIEVAAEVVLGNLIRFERIYTFREGPNADARGVIRKRKQWLLYVDKWLICLTWQGANPDVYQYWFAMANHSFLTFEIPEALWFFTDRELRAQSHSPA